MKFLPAVPSSFLPVAGLVSLLAGCATSTPFQVDASRRPDPGAAPRFSYQLVSANPDFAAGHTNVARMSRALRTALSSRGLFEAPAGVAPQLDIEFDFGLEGPRIISRESTIRAPGPESHRPIGGFSFEGTAERLDEGPTVVAEDRTVVDQVRLYRKFLRVTARRSGHAVDQAPPLPLWSVFVENEDESRDLARYLTLMAAAAMDTLGEDTTAPRSVKLTRRDGRVLFVQAEMTD